MDACGSMTSWSSRYVGDASDKLNANASNKKQAAVVAADANYAPADSSESEPVNEQDGDDQWVMQGGKQVGSPCSITFVP